MAREFPVLGRPNSGQQWGDDMRTIKKDHRMLSEKGDRRSRSETGAVHPAVPAVILLVSFAVFMAAVAPLDFTSIFRKFFPVQIQQVPHKDAAVWVDKTAGVYYCADSIMFGKTQGAYMKQVEALDRGYQPALGTYCTGPAWSLHGEFNKLAAPPSAPATKPDAAQPAAPSTFENPNYKPEGRNIPNPGAGSSQQFIPD
jgi:hypothetical protein